MQQYILMSNLYQTNLYRRYGQGEPVKSDEFTLTSENIDQYLNFAVQMNEEINWIHHMIDVKYKLEHLDEVDDELYTEEYLNRRLAKIMGKHEMTPELEHLRTIKKALMEVNRELDVVRPLVFDKEEGKKEENHIRMNDLNDRMKETEDKIDAFYEDRYPKLKKHLRKIYYMIIDGVDMNTVKSCFIQMKHVLNKEKSAEQAANTLMDESQARYNLPSTIWDPIRSGASAKPLKKKRK